MDGKGLCDPNIPGTAPNIPITSPEQRRNSTGHPWIPRRASNHGTSPEHPQTSPEDPRNSHETLDTPPIPTRPWFAGLGGSSCLWASCGQKIQQQWHSHGSAPFASDVQGGRAPEMNGIESRCRRFHLKQTAQKTAAAKGRGTPSPHVTVLRWFPLKALDSHPFFPSQVASDDCRSLGYEWGPVIGLLGLWLMMLG